jgi:hypothetical protein
MRALVLVALVGCIDVSDVHTCGTSADCGTAGRCEPSHFCSFADDVCGGTGGFRYGEHAGNGRANQCVYATAIPFSISATLLDHDDVKSGCPNAGAGDAMFELHTEDPQIIFVDTAGVGSSAPAILSVYAGSCPPTGAPLNQPGCRVAPNCPDPYEAYNFLPSPASSPGNYCVVAEQEEPGRETSVALRVLPSQRGVTDYVPGMPTQMINSCEGQQNVATTCGGAQAPEAAFIVAGLCPMQTVPLHVVVSSSTFPVVASLHESLPQMPAITCSNTPSPTENIDIPIMGPGPYWVVVEGAAPMPCGLFTATISLQ